MSEAIEPVSLDNCEREPIHIPGAIQPHGVLLACRGPSLAVTQASASAEAFLGKRAADLLGQPLAAILDEESLRHLQGLLGLESLREANPFRVATLEGKTFDASVHHSGGAVVVELEPAQTGRAEVGGFDPRLRASVLRLQHAGDLAKLTAIAAEEVRTLTGFDRVMVYRFDADWNGEVVAESKREDLAPFFGMHYPASDIPAQARRLYTINWLRFIGDVAYVPSPVQPTLDPETKAPLDLSHSALRSVSPIHIEYLRNMGVSASMSISLVIDGQLAGLIACHHYSGPRLLPPAIRGTAEYLGYTLSWQLSVLQGAEQAQRTRDAQAHEAAVMRAVAVAPELIDGLDSPDLVKLTESSGAAVVLEEGLRKLGQTPDTAAIRTIVAWLRTHAPDVFSTDHLAKHIPGAEAWEDTAAGLVAVAIARELGEYLLWFRPAEAKVVNWAGDPRKKEVVAEAGRAPRLSPRGSFELWCEVVKGRSRPWQPWQLGAASSLRSVLLGGVRRRSAQLRSLNQRLLDADRSKDNFIAMVSHELRTPLTSINGWTTLLKSGRVDASKTQHALEIIAKNVQAQSQLVEDLLDVSRMTSGKLALEVQTIDIMSIVASTAEATALAIEAKGIQLMRDLDPSVTIVRGDALRLRQVVTNLIANAVKFTPKGGKITVGLKRVESDVELSVADTGQGIAQDFLPHVFEAFRQEDAGVSRRSQGLGLGLAIARKLVELHGGKIVAESEGVGKGATFKVRLPITPFTAEKVPVEGEVPKPAEANELEGVKILVVEDEPDSREIIQSILESSKADVIAAPDAKTALVILETERFDVIVSDVGMPDMDGMSFIRELRSRPADREQRTPAIALTAYTRVADRTTALQAGFQAHVPKPVDSQELVATILSLIDRPTEG